MAINTTTLSNAVAVTDRQMVVASATGFAANKKVRVDGEWMMVAQSYVSGTTIPILRGQNGTVTAAHNSSANVIVGDALTDFSLVAPAGFGEAAVMPGATPWASVTSYSATGAITVPNTVGMNLVILNGTSALTMTLAAPTNDMDGAIVWVIANGSAAHVFRPAGNNGIGNAGAGYRNLTFAAGAQNSVICVAANGNWVPVSLYGGTATNITVTLS